MNFLSRLFFEFEIMDSFNFEKFPFKVTVGDLNDNAPTFSVQMYKALLVENNDIGASILRVSASDLDSGENGLLFEC